jgi:hypothetical protein
MDIDICNEMAAIASGRRAFVTLLGSAPNSFEIAAGWRGEIE